ncbi:MAG: hypothetical protein ACOYOU_09070 [Kiritimatiellia bacterium]
MHEDEQHEDGNVTVPHTARRRTASIRVSDGAGTYYRWLMNCLDGIEKDVPRIIPSAEAAARVHVEGGAIGIDGDASFLYEGFGRCGGLMSLATRRPDMRIRLTGLVDSGASAGALAGVDRRPDGWIRIGFGSGCVLDRAIAEGAPFDHVVRNHAAVHNGLFPLGDGLWMVPTVQHANLVALWVWTGEFVAACTRLGKMPLMFQGFAFPGGRERALKLGGPAVLGGAGCGSEWLFHDQPPEPVAAGVTGRAYLLEVRAILERVWSRETGNIRRAATVAAQAREKGHTIRVAAEFHAFNGIRNRPCNASWLSYGMPRDAGSNSIKAGDVILCMGYTEVRKDCADAARAAGATFMTSFSSCLERRRLSERPTGENRRPDELFIDQHWPFGDAVVQFPGYDIKLLPPSGVVGEAILQMFTAEVYTLLAAAGNNPEDTR